MQTDARTKLNLSSSARGQREAAGETNGGERKQSGRGEQKAGLSRWKNGEATLVYFYRVLFRGLRFKQSVVFCGNDAALAVNQSKDTRLRRIGTIRGERDFGVRKRTEW